VNVNGKDGQEEGEMRRRSFEVDRSQAKLMGVCAGIARMTDIDATIVRIGFVVATLIGGWPWTLVAYVALGLIGRHKSGGRLRRAGHSYDGLEQPSAGRELDRRMAEIDHYVASSNGRLAREIEELR
jgi:phage shock protein C